MKENKRAVMAQRESERVEEREIVEERESRRERESGEKRRQVSSGFRTSVKVSH